jgi:XRE family transcriptional regulator, regulator of sulfur utilization
MHYCCHMATQDATALDALADLVGRVIRMHRGAQGMSLGDLGRASGLSKTILARIEAGDGNPSLETLWRISRALRVPLGELLGNDEGPRVRVIRHGAGEELHAESGMSAWLLHADGRERRTEVFELRFDAGVEQRAEPHLPGTEELVVCTRGRMRVGPAGEQAELAQGDAVWFAADVPHGYAGLRDAQALCWMLYPPAQR